MNIYNEEFIKTLQDEYKFIDSNTIDKLLNTNKENLLNILKLNNSENNINDNISKIKSVFESSNKMFPSNAIEYNIYYEQNIYNIDFMIDDLCCGYKINWSLKKIFHKEKIMRSYYNFLDITPENINILYKQKMDRINMINKINALSILTLKDKVNAVENFSKNDYSSTIENEDIDIAIELINKIYSKIKYEGGNISYNRYDDILFHTKHNYIKFSANTVEKFIETILLTYPHLNLEKVDKLNNSINIYDLLLE